MKPVTRLPMRNYDPHPILPLRQIVLETFTRNSACIFYLNAESIYVDRLLVTLERLQNCILRFIFGLHKQDHVSEFRSNLKCCQFAIAGMLIFLPSSAYFGERFNFLHETHSRVCSLESLSLKISKRSSHAMDKSSCPDSSLMERPTGSFPNRLIHLSNWQKLFFYFYVQYIIVNKYHKLTPSIVYVVYVFSIVAIIIIM